MRTRWTRAWSRFRRPVRSVKRRWLPELDAHHGLSFQAVKQAFLVVAEGPWWSWTGCVLKTSGLILILNRALTLGQVGISCSRTAE